MGVRGSGCLSDGQEIGKLPKSSILPFYFSPGPLNSEKSRLKLIGFGQNGKGERPTLLFSQLDNICHWDFYAVDVCHWIFSADDVSHWDFYADHLPNQTLIHSAPAYDYLNFELKVALNLR